MDWNDGDSMVLKNDRPKVYKQIELHAVLLYQFITWCIVHPIKKACTYTTRCTLAMSPSLKINVSMCYIIFMVLTAYLCCYVLTIKINCDLKTWNPNTYGSVLARMSVAVGCWTHASAVNERLCMCFIVLYDLKGNWNATKTLFQNMWLTRNQYLNLIHSHKAFIFTM